MGTVASQVCCEPRNPKTAQVSTILAPGKKTGSPNHKLMIDTTSNTTGNHNEPLSPHTPKTKLALKDFQLVKVIGKGSIGKVYMAVRQPSGEVIALKRLKKKEIEDMMLSENVLTEKLILQKSSHPFVAKLLYAFQNESHIFIGMEYIKGGMLFSHLRQRQRFGEEEAIFYASEVLLALQYLHEELGVMYRDLKPENILLAEDGHVKLTDFGLSKFGQNAASFCGTPEYFAPEIVRHENYGVAVDWWSFGCLLFEILTGQPPFQDENIQGLFDKILAGKVIYPDTMSATAKDLISKLLNPVASARLGAKCAKDVMEHPFFASLDWNKVLHKEMKPPFLPNETLDESVLKMTVEQTPAPPGMINYGGFTYQKPSEKFLQRMSRVSKV